MRGHLLFLALAAGCQSRITGNEGILEFAYPADDDVVDFNKPLAVGASLDISVAEAGTHQPVTLRAAATSGSPLAVLGVEGGAVTIQGAAEGEALLTVEAETLAGEVLSDSINLLARVPEVLRLGHTCAAEGEPAYYLADSRIWLPFELEMATGQPVIGYGYYPLLVEGDAAALDAASSDQAWLAFDTGAAAGSVLLTSEIDETTLGLAVVTAGQVDGAAAPIPFVGEDIDVGETGSLYVVPTVGGVKVCQAELDMVVQSATPEICDVRQTTAVASDNRESGWIEIEGLAAGTCRYTVTFPAGDNGGGATRGFTFEIQP